MNCEPGMSGSGGEVCLIRRTVASGKVLLNPSL